MREMKIAVHFIIRAKHPVKRNLMNNDLKIMALISIAFALSACSGMVQMMPRDSGKVYSGTVKGSLGGSGTMTVTIDGEAFSGPIVRTTSNESFGFTQQYGRGGSTVGLSAADGGTHLVKAILSSPSGRGLRCEFSSDGNGGGGICVDDKSRIYDAVVTR
jgi:hypothetical protein